MRPYDDDLDRMLAELPMAEPPAALRARIIAATMDAPRIAIASWESALYGVLAALVVWGALVIARSPAAGAYAAAAIAWAATAIHLPTMLWTAAGGVVALWYLLLTGNSGGGHRLRA